ncbi:MAG TPA: diacylglycerol kinase family protein [Bacillota bacterium]|nr:diacylglycerol kinase family protein [Bacillota bacterium]
MRELKRLVQSFGHAIDGIVFTVKTQRNMQIHVGAAFFVLLVGWLLQIPWSGIMLVFFSIFFVLILEMVNTAIEVTVDLITKEIHPLAKIAKDVAAGAVLLGVILAIVVGFYVFIPPIISLLDH